MYLIDTNVISEQRKQHKANQGVLRFFDTAQQHHHRLFLSVITIGELQYGAQLVRHRGDCAQANHLDDWLNQILTVYKSNILDLDVDTARLWGQLRVPHREHILDKQIAATAMIYDLTLVTRNTKDFLKTGVRLLNPFDEII